MEAAVIDGSVGPGLRPLKGSRGRLIGPGFQPQSSGRASGGITIAASGSAQSSGMSTPSASGISDA